MKLITLEEAFSDFHFPEIHKKIQALNQAGLFCFHFPLFAGQLLKTPEALSNFMKLEGFNRETLKKYKWVS